jgi:hypothetical protein
MASSVGATADSEMGGSPDSPSFSVFTPSVVNVERQEARSNLIRKLSKRDNNSPTAPSPVPPEVTSGRLAGNFKFGGGAAAPAPAVKRPAPRQDSDDELEQLSTAPGSVRSSVVTNAPSEFRAYRHTYERDRDSAYAKLMQEDHFEYEGLLARKASIKAQKEREQQLKGSPKSIASSRATPVIPEHDSYISPDPTYQFPTPPRTADSTVDPDWPHRFNNLSVRQIAHAYRTMSLSV